jgi:hypothetical protein
VGASDPRGVVDDGAAGAAARAAEVRPVLGPNSAISGSSGDSASSRTVWIPSSASRPAMRLPTPHSAVVGRSPITCIQLSLVSR